MEIDFPVAVWLLFSAVVEANMQSKCGNLLLCEYCPLDTFIRVYITSSKWAVPQQVSGASQQLRGVSQKVITKLNVMLKSYSENPQIKNEPTRLKSSGSSGSSTSSDTYIQHLKGKQ